MDEVSLVLRVRLHDPAGAEVGVEHPVARGKLRGLLVLRQARRARADVVTRLPYKPIAGRFRVFQQPRRDVQYEPRGVSGRAVDVPARRLGDVQPSAAPASGRRGQRRSSSMAFCVRTFRDGKMPSFMPQRKTCGNSRPLAACTVMSFTLSPPASASWFVNSATWLR